MVEGGEAAARLDVDAVLGDRVYDDCDRAGELHRAQDQHRPPDRLPASRGQLAVREPQHGQHEQDESGRPRGLHQHGEPAERKAAVAEPVAQDQVEAGVGAEREQAGLAQQEPAERVARVVARNQQSDEGEHQARRDQGDRGQRVVVGQDRERNVPGHQRQDDPAENARVSRGCHRKPERKPRDTPFRDRYGLPLETITAWT